MAHSHVRIAILSNGFPIIISNKENICTKKNVIIAGLHVLEIYVPAIVTHTIALNVGDMLLIQDQVKR